MNAGAFDPWTLSLEEVGSRLEALSPEQLWQWSMAQGIKERRDEILNGEGRAVLEAIDECAKHGLTLPDWLAEDFRRRLNTVRQHQAISWDDAFGKPHPKKTHLKTLIKESRAGPVIWYMVQKLHRQDGRPIDMALFEEVAERLGNTVGLGRSECQRIYYKVAPEMEARHPPTAGRTRDAV